jgi:hypothetical protein
VNDSTYFRFSRIVSSTSQAGIERVSTPLHLLIRVNKKEVQPDAEVKDPKRRAMDSLAPFCGGISPHPDLVMPISEAEANKAHVLQTVANHHDGALFSVEWPLGF